MCKPPNWCRIKTQIQRLFFNKLSKKLIIHIKSNKNVELVLVKRVNQSGAAYIEEISYNRANNLPKEYEVLLQKRVEYRIMEVQKFKGKYIIVAEVQ